MRSSVPCPDGELIHEKITCGDELLCVVGQVKDV